MSQCLHVQGHVSELSVISVHILAVAVALKVPVGDDGKRASFRNESPSQPLIDPADVDLTGILTNIALQVWHSC